MSKARDIISNENIHCIVHCYVSLGGLFYQFHLHKKYIVITTLPVKPLTLALYRKVMQAIDLILNYVF